MRRVRRNVQHQAQASTILPRHVQGQAQRAADETQAWHGRGPTESTQEPTPLVALRERALTMLLNRDYDELTEFLRGLR